MEDDENRIYFIKDVEIADGKTDITHAALSNEIEKCGGVKSLSRYGSDRESIMTECKEIASKLKRDNPKTISIYCQQL